MVDFFLHGDVLVSGVVKVTVDSLDEAIEKAERGEFMVHDAGKPDGFKFCGPVVNECGQEVDLLPS